jgi:hypothetical protein
MHELMDAIAYDYGLCLFSRCSPRYYDDLFFFFLAMNVFFTFGVIVSRRRGLMIGCAIVSGVELGWWLLVAIANHEVRMLTAWPAAILVVVLWRLFHRPPRLYVPPPEPASLGGPYR